MRAKKAASGMRPLPTSRSMQSDRRPSRKAARNSTLCLPWSWAEVTSAVMPSAEPVAVCSSSRPDRSLARARQSLATCTTGQQAMLSGAGIAGCEAATAVARLRTAACIAVQCTDAELAS